MPSPGDPSFDREARAARARQAVSQASEERLAELRSQHLPPAGKRAAGRPAAQTRAAARPAARPADRPKGSIDAAAIGRTARAALDKHPATWTSYAELCSATGLTRNLALTVARQLVLEPTGTHWFRIRNEDGVYNVPVEDADGGDTSPFSREEADRQLTAAGVAVADERADPLRKLAWTGSGWALPHSD